MCEIIPSDRQNKKLEGWFSSINKNQEVQNMWERFKFWFMGYKDCQGCCLGCSFFEECKADVMTEAAEREAYERDVCIDSIIKERMVNSCDRRSA